MIGSQQKRILLFTVCFFSLMNVYKFIFMIKHSVIIGDESNWQVTNERPTNLTATHHLTEDHRWTEFNTGSRLLFPSENHNDRIIEQLGLTSTKQRPNQGPSERKKILVVDGYPRGVYPGGMTFRQENCPVRRCVLTDNPQDATEADALIFQGNIGHADQKLSKLQHQVWIFYQLESPMHTDPLHLPHTGYINWTATYRADSTIVTPYAKFVPYNKLIGHRDSISPFKTKDYSGGKSKLVAWFVSNCDTMNGRMQYAQELQRHIEVDIYGECGNLRCSRNDAAKCFLMLQRQYKFYLAFENSSCKDYITEKLFVNSLRNDVVPVVLGAPPEDYRRVAPPGSYIHVDDFNSPYHLAQYLHHLDRNSTLYNKYFEWKSQGRFINTKFWCRLCSMLHHMEGHVTWYEDMDAWWKHPGVCNR